jgi:hypothetical protein
MYNMFTYRVLRNIPDFYTHPSSRYLGQGPCGRKWEFNEKRKGKIQKNRKKRGKCMENKKGKGKTFTTEGNNKGKKCTWGGIPADVGSEM